MRSKWAVTFYGFLEADAIGDSTESFNDNAGIGLVARPGTYAGEHRRWMEGMRNSRIGFKIAAPETDGVRASGLVEVDFLGNQPPGSTETAFWSGAGMRVRHVMLKLETDYVDLLFGQYWTLFGWQTIFQPCTVQLQGVPGELFSRTAQFRLSHLFTGDAVSFELAAAAVRAPQRDAGYPDGQGGLRFAINKWKGVHMAQGGAGQMVDGMGIGVSGLIREFRVVEFLPPQTASNTKKGWGVSVDALLPVIPATSARHGNSLTIIGSVQTGSGFADQYSGLTGGVTFPAVPNPTMATPAPTYTPNVDPGLVTYDVAGELHTINWNSIRAGFQYYFPPSGNVWISANVSQMKSDNIASFGANPKAVFNKIQWADGNLFWNVTSAARFGAEYATYRETYADGTLAKNTRVQFSGFLLF